MIKYKSFEDYVIDQHAKQYTGFDDEMPDNFNKWCQELDVDDWLLMGEKYAGIRELKGYDLASETALKKLRGLK
jgi:hypothetical protein